VGHIVNKVVLEFRHLLLPYDKIYRDKEYYKEEYSKEECQKYHVGNLKDILIKVWEMHTHNTHLSRGIISK
jgi:hypothetical protein